MGAEVDEGVAALLEHLAGQGVRTVFSCENDGGRAYIMFESGPDFERGVRLLAELAHDGGFEKLRFQVLQAPGYISWDPDEGWSYEVSVQTGWSRGASIGEPRFDYTLRMPTEDLALFNSTLADAGTGQGTRASEAGRN